MSKGNPNYWDPSARVFQLCGDVVKTEHPSFDLYRGSADALIQSGIIDRELLPGQPGRCNTMATYRPLGIQKKPKSWWHEVPGYMVINRHVNEVFCIRIRVGDEEYARRHIAYKAAIAAGDAARAVSRADAAMRRFEEERRLEGQRVSRRGSPQYDGRPSLRLVWSAPS